MNVRETSRDYRHPHRPLAIRALNTVLGPLADRVVSLAPDSLRRAATRATGLSDFGSADYEEPLTRLIASIEAEAQLHAVGRMIVRTRLVSSLATRLRIEAAHRADPGLAALRVERPIVIVGLPRTGTTLLHRLLAADRRNRALLSWEAVNPAPLAPPREGVRDPRIAHAELAERALAWMAPDFFAVHPVEAHAPEEEVLLLDLAFRSTVAEATLRVPSFARWLEGADQMPAYRYLVRALQVLTRARPPDVGRGGRWVLKTPHHLEWLDELVATFPDALVVWTHRDASEIFGSFASMLAHGRGVFSDAIDPIDIGRTWRAKSERMLSRGRAARARIGERAFFDVAYADFVRDPLEVALAITERAGATRTRETETSMRDLLARHAQHRHGVHRYDARDFEPRA